MALYYNLADGEHDPYNWKAHRVSCLDVANDPLPSL
jgi:hypothetical protein